MKDCVRVKISMKDSRRIVDISCFDIKDDSGDIYYRTIPNIVYDHFSFYCDGNVLVSNKQKKSVHRHIKLANFIPRIPIQKLGQAQLLSEFIGDTSKLIEKELKPKEDVRIFLKVRKIPIKIFIRLDLLSGANLVNDEYEKIPKEDHEGKHLFSHMCPMGVRSGQRDKIIFINAFEGKRERNLEREIFIPSMKGKEKSFIKE